MKKLSDFLKKPLGLFLGWRIFLFIPAVIGPFIIKNWGNRFPYSQELLVSSRLPYWLWSWGNFDGVHYLSIAKSFYSAYYTQTFFPVYPLLVRLVSAIFFNQTLLSALLVSNLCFLFSLIVFNKLLFLEGYKKQSVWILLFCVLFPTSFYFGAIYTESLFLLLVVSIFYAWKTKKWLLAGILGAIASATRLFGILIFFSLAYDIYLQYRKKQQRFNKQLFALFLIPLGLLLYMVYLHFSFGDALLFWHVQPVFGASRSGSGIILFPQVIYRYLKILTSVNALSLPFWNALLEIASFIAVAIILVVGTLKKINPSYLIYSWLSLLLPTLTGTFSSLPRYILVIFPIYIILGGIKDRRFKISLLVLNSLILLILTMLFARGYWVA